MHKYLAAILGFLMVVNMADAQTHKGYEMPPYTVQQVDGDIELRLYGAHTAAEVTVAGNSDSAIGTGFRVLAGYIFGGNADGQKITMTVPVAQSPAPVEGQWTVRFMMPAAFDAATLPAPDDARIRFVTAAPERQVALRFSGLRGSAVLAAKTTALRAWAETAGLKITAGPHVYFYDGPMTLPWNRRNEVAFTVQ
jgi:SOUL heme-binding protein